MPTIKDVAREAGVSIATVSYVLNNKTDSISEDTCRLVLETAERIGYAPNVTARNLRYNRAGLIGYAWHEIPEGLDNPILDRFTYYLARAVEYAGYHLLTFTYPSQDPIPVYSELIRTGRVDGFVLAGTTTNDPRIEFLLEQGFPFVSFGRSNIDWDFPWVDTDGHQGVQEAVNYLLTLGHRRIGIIAWEEHDIVSAFRLGGYQTALRAAGIPLRPEYIVHGPHSEQLGRDAVNTWLGMPADERPTAVVAVSDHEAVSAMREAERQHMVIGRDLSIIGFDDLPLSQHLRPALTTIQQPIPEISQRLVEILESLLNHRDIAERHLLVPPRLVIRESCGMPN